jgi:peptidoglycan/xylan/chitin deacetylase (PgdA/CDA1 family)
LKPDAEMKAIMYHYVRPAPDQLPYFRYLHIQDFARQLDWLGERHGFVSRDAFELALATGEAPAGVVLTFDDGLADHHEHVLPELCKRGLFGFFYVCTSPLERCKLLDVHRIHLLLGRLGGQRALKRLTGRLREGMLSDAHRGEFNEATYANQDNDLATNTFKRILNYLISYDVREGILDELFDEEFADEGNAARRFYLDADQIRDMDHAGMVIGSHGVGHYVFSKLSLSRQREEITGSFTALSRILGKPVDTFCYPYGGRHTFTADTVALLQEAGTRFAFDVNARDITSADLAGMPHALPRYDCNMFPNGLASTGAARARQAPWPDIERGIKSVAGPNRPAACVPAGCQVGPAARR